MPILHTLWIWNFMYKFRYGEQILLLKVLQIFAPKKVLLLTCNNFYYRIFSWHKFLARIHFFISREGIWKEFITWRYMHSFQIFVIIYSMFRIPISTIHTRLNPLLSFLTGVQQQDGVNSRTLLRKLDRVIGMKYMT